MKTGLFLVVALACSGCDFFRSLAGRPTSADIEAKREKMEREEALHIAMLDSLNATQQTLRDSLVFADSVRMCGGTIVKAGRLSGLNAAKLPHRFYIVVGAFANRDNAARQADVARSAGFETEVVELSSGYRAVMLCPSDNLAETYAELKSVKSEKFCPPDVWILVNE